MYVYICMHIPTVTLRFAYRYVGFYIYTRLGVCVVRGFRTRVFFLQKCVTKKIKTN